MDTEQLVLQPESDILRYSRIVALTVRDIQAHQVLWGEEEHVLILRNTLESLCVVGELVSSICSASVSEKDALHLVWTRGSEHGIVTHDVGIAGISDKDEFPVWIRIEDLFEQEFTDGEGSRYIAEVEGPRIEGASWVCLVNEVHVVACHLLRSCRQVVKVHIGEAA